MSVSSRLVQDTCYEIVIVDKVGWQTTILERDTLEQALAVFEKEKKASEQAGAKVNILINKVVRTKVQELLNGKIYTD